MSSDNVSVPEAYGFTHQGCYPDDCAWSGFSGDACPVPGSPQPAPKCGESYGGTGPQRACDLPAGHEGSHRADGRRWLDAAPADNALAKALEGLRVGGCWCEVGVGNPMVRGHSPQCDAARAALAGLTGK